MPVYYNNTVRSTRGSSSHGSDGPSLPKETFRGKPITVGVFQELNP